MILSVDGREYKSLHIIRYTPKIELLDGEGTGRTKADSWDMIRQPQGYIINFGLEFASTTSDNPDFIHFWQMALSLGEREFVTVKFIDPLGAVIEQEMYYVISEVEFRRVEDSGRVFTGAIKASFIAKKGK